MHISDSESFSQELLSAGVDGQESLGGVDGGADEND